MKRRPTIAELLGGIGALVSTSIAVYVFTLDYPRAAVVMIALSLWIMALVVSLSRTESSAGVLDATGAPIRTAAYAFPRRLRSVSVALASCLPILGATYLSIEIAASQNITFREDFERIGSGGALLERGWEVLDKESDFWNRPDRNGYLTLYTLQGDLWVKDDEVRSVKSLVRHRVAGGEYQATTALADFHPKRNWEQAGLFLIQDAANYVRITCSYADVGGRGVIRIQVIPMEGGDPVEPIDKVVCDADRPPARVWLQIVKRGDAFTFRYHLGEEWHPWIDLGTREPPSVEIRPRWVGLGAFSGHTEVLADGTRRALNWPEKVPAHFDFVEVRGLGDED